MMIYLLIGTLWCWWLEWYTTHHEIAGHMSFIERIIIIGLWPLYVLIFLKNLR